MTGTTISATQYEALLHMFKFGDKNDIEAAHRMTLQNGGWAKPGHDLSVLNNLSEQDMHTGLNVGWNIVSDEHYPAENARQAAAMSIAKNGIYGIMPTPAAPNIPAHLSISYEQETAIEEALKSVEHDVEALIYIHRAMRAHGGWTTPGRIALNDLSETDIRCVLSSECQVTVAKPRPVVLIPRKNGYPLTKGQVKTIEDWFAKPENRNLGREDLLRILKTDGYPDDLYVVHAATPEQMSTILYVGYHPLD